MAHRRHIGPLQQIVGAPRRSVEAAREQLHGNLEARQLHSVTRVQRPRQARLGERLVEPADMVERTHARHMCEVE
jgi:hypothetical protein